MAKRIHFWDSVRGPVKITLAVGESVHHTYAYDNGEGWTRVSRMWSFDGKRVHALLVSDGSDCDGRHRSECELFFEASKRRHGVIDTEHRDVVYPRWEVEAERQRDYAAEAMGY